MTDNRNIRGGADRARIRSDGPPANQRSGRHVEPDGMPGRRADLPPGSLGPQHQAASAAKQLGIALVLLDRPV